MKGIIITAANQSMLLNRFTTALDLEQLPIGYILVTDFGNDDTFEVLTTAMFNANYEVVPGEPLQNEFFAVDRKT